MSRSCDFSHSHWYIILGLDSYTITLDIPVVADEEITISSGIVVISSLNGASAINWNYPTTDGLVQNGRIRVESITLTPL